MTKSGATTPGQNGPGSDGKTASITGASPIDIFVPGITYTHWPGVLPSAEMLSAYSPAPPDRAIFFPL